MRRWLLTTVLLGACAHAPPATHLAATTRMCERGARGCVASAELERTMESGPLVVEESWPLPHGFSHAKMLVVSLDGARVRLKWKEARRGGEGHNRSPRRELAAWAVAKLLLDHPEEVVPPTVVRCLDAAEYRAAFHRREHHTFGGADCALGTLSYWLEDVEELRGFDRDRYARDPGYRAAIGRLNLVTYVVDHRDAKDANFVITRARPVHVLSVDNGLSFSGFRTFRGYLVQDWSHLRVPSLPRDAVDRLKRITRGDLERLAVVAQLELRDGRLVPVAPGPPIPSDEGVRRRGGTIQLGLTPDEIAGVERRIRHILELESSGRLATFDAPDAASRARTADAPGRPPRGRRTAWAGHR